MSLEDKEALRIRWWRKELSGDGLKVGFQSPYFSTEGDGQRLQTGLQPQGPY